MALYCRIKGVENSLMGAFNFSDHYSFTEGQRFNIALKSCHGRSVVPPRRVSFPPSNGTAFTGNCPLPTAYRLLPTAVALAPNELRGNGTLVGLSWPEESVKNRVLFARFFRNSR